MTVIEIKQPLKIFEEGYFVKRQMLDGLGMDLFSLDP